MTTLQKELKEGDMVSFDTGILTEKAYVILIFMENGVALCQDKAGHRFKFSRNRLIAANKTQVDEYLK